MQFPNQGSSHRFQAPLSSTSQHPGSLWLGRLFLSPGTGLPPVACFGLCQEEQSEHVQRLPDFVLLSAVTEEPLSGSCCLSSLDGGVSNGGTGLQGVGNQPALWRH